MSTSKARIRPVCCTRGRQWGRGQNPRACMLPSPPASCMALTCLPCMLRHIPQRLTGIKGLSEAKVDKMLAAARSVVPNASWITGTEALQQVCLVVPEWVGEGWSNLACDAA